MGYVNGLGTWGLQRCINGTWTAITSVAGTVAVGDIILLEVIGGLLRLYKNGLQLIATSDASGNPGNTLGTGDVGVVTASTGGLADFVGSPANLPGVPTILVPVYTAETKVNGLGSPGLYVELYKGGVLQATVSVDSNGRWGYTFGAGLGTGDVLKARQKTDKGDFGAYCADITVQAAVVSPPHIVAGLYSGNTDVVGLARPGSAVEVFKDGLSQGSVVADGVGVFRLTLGSALVTNSVFTAKQTIAGTQSAASASVKVLAAPTDTDTYKTNIFDTLTLFAFTKNAADTDDIRRSVAQLLTQASLLGSSTTEIKQGVAGLFYQYAMRIAGRVS